MMYYLKWPKLTNQGSTFDIVQSGSCLLPGNILNLIVSLWGLEIRDSRRCGVLTGFALWQNKRLGKRIQFGPHSIENFSMHSEFVTAWTKSTIFRPVYQLKGYMTEIEEFYSMDGTYSCISFKVLYHVPGCWHNCISRHSFISTQRSPSKRKPSLQLQL